MAEKVSSEGAEFDEDIFESMVDGSFEPEEVSVEEDDVDDEEIVDDEEVLEDEDDDDDNEDTDLEEEDSDESELDDPIDGDDDEELEEDEDDEEEDTPVEEDDSDDEDEDVEDEDEDADEADESEDEDLDEESEDDTETDENSDGDAPETGKVDYKAFYDAVVNTEFKVNGRKTKGFSDPQKIIQSMQMAGGFSDKMAGFKQYRPFMNPLKERGMLEDETKFNLAMNIIDGDKEAIKQHLQALKIDPLDLDMEAIKYEGKSATASDASIVVDESIERAKSGGYEDRFRSVIGKEWDAASFNEFVDNPKVRSDLLEHMESGAYDKVTDKMAEMSRLDYNGSFGDMSTISKYRAAVVQLQSEAPAPVVEETKVAKKAPVKTVKKTSVAAEKAKIAQARKEVKYKKEVEAKNAKMAKQRKRASSMSKKKPKAKPAAKFDPLKAEGEDLDALMEHLINGGR